MPNFTELIQRLSPKLKAIAYKAGYRYIFFSAEDLYQEALVHLWQEYRRGLLVDKTDSYILQGCYFYLKNYLRTHCDKARLVSIENSPGREGQATALKDILSQEDPHSGFDLINAELLIEKINNNGLTPREKEVFSLALEGLTAREIGKRLGISHVRVIKLRGKIKAKCSRYVDF